MSMDRGSTGLSILRPENLIVPGLMGVLLVGLEQTNFPIFHLFSELFSIAISFIIFAFVFSTHKFSHNTYLLCLACGYFWIGSSDFIHALSYKGMDLIVHDNGNQSAQFWIGTRFFEAVLLLLAPALSRRFDNKWGYFLIFGLILSVVAGAIFTGNFPVMFTDETGLTDFKIMSEYLIIFILAAALVIMIRERDCITPYERGLIVAAILTTMAAEIAFTLYEDVFGVANMIGHIIKIFSFWYLFQAVVGANLERPFQALVEAEKKFHKAASIGALGTYHLDIKTLAWDKSPTLDKIYGIDESFQRNVGSWLDIVHPQDRKDMQAYLSNEVIDKKASFDRVYRIIRPDNNQTRWVHGYGDLTLGENREPSTLVGVIQDVTDLTLSGFLKKAQIEITAHAWSLGETELLQLVLHWCEKVTDSQVSFFHFINEDQNTISLAAWSKRTLEEYCHVEQLDEHYPISKAGVWAESFHARCPVVFNDYAQTKNKKGLPSGHSPLERLISMPLIENDKVRVLLGVGNKLGHYTDDDVRMLSILIDQVWHIISQKRAEKSALELSQAVSQSPAMIIMTDLEGRITYVNPAFTTITGFSEAETIGNTPGILKSGEMQASIYEDLWQTILAGGIWTNLMHNRKKDGTLFWASVVISALRDEKNKIVGFLGITEDVTEQLETSTQLLQAQKVNSVGQMASGIAHDINNMLMPIIGLGELISKDLADDPKQANRFKKILEAAHRSRGMLKPLVDFGRTDMQNRQIVDIAEVVVNALDIIRPAMPSTLEVTVQIESDVGNVLLDADAFSSVLMNFASNARDAMNKGSGKMSCSLIKVVAEDVLCRSLPGLVQGKSYALFTAHDEGQGISQDNLENIFDPFFTTKDVGKGAGLGLAMVHKTIQLNDGVIRARSKVGKWTAFDVFLPIVDDEEQEE